MNIKERIRLIIDHICNADIGEYEILASLRAILADLDAEPRKPTGEPDAMAIIKQALTDYADVFVDLIVERLKDAPPQPAQMICNHAGECKVAGCPSITVHDEVRDCKKIGGVNCPFPDAICVPWVEPVKALMSTCEGCHKEFGDGDCFEECTGYTDSAAFRTMPRHNYTPKQPEPVKHTSCEGCGNGEIYSCGHRACIEPDTGIRRDYTPAQPEPAAPGLVSCPIISANRRWEWMVVGESFGCLLGSVVYDNDFHHIELKSGATVTTLSAFAENNPPVRAWFRI